MARMTFGQKMARVVKLLFGLGDPIIFNTMRHYGFDRAELDKGWALMGATGTSKLDVMGDEGYEPYVDTTPKLLEALDEWDNKWTVVAKATLQYSHPTLYEHIFANLGQTDGRQLAFSLALFIERLEQAQATDEGKEARELLRRRGLTDAVVDQALALTKACHTPVTPDPTPPDELMEASIEAQRRAEDEVWSWYLQWSAISRVAIKDRRLLRKLGFLQKSASKEGEDEE